MVKRILHKFIRFIQTILVIFFLTGIYFLVFGITLIFTAIFNRKALTGFTKDDKTFWVEVNACAASMEDSLRQS